MVFPDLIEEVECTATRTFYQDMFKCARKFANTGMTLEFEPTTLLHVLRLAQVTVNIPQRSLPVKNKIDVTGENVDTSVVQFVKKQEDTFEKVVEYCASVANGGGVQQFPPQNETKLVTCVDEFCQTCVS